MALQYLHIILKFCIFCKFCNVSLLEIENSFVIKSIFLSLFLLTPIVCHEISACVDNVWAARQIIVQDAN